MQWTWPPSYDRNSGLLASRAVSEGASGSHPPITRRAPSNWDPYWRCNPFQNNSSDSRMSLVVFLYQVQCERNESAIEYCCQFCDHGEHAIFRHYLLRRSARCIHHVQTTAAAAAQLCAPTAVLQAAVQGFHALSGVCRPEFTSSCCSVGAGLL